MTYPATNSKEASELLIDVSNQMHEIVNEDATTEVVTESGLVPSVRKALADTFLFQDPIAWNQGNDETAFNQLRTFNGNIYWAPTATTLNPIPMGVTPEGDNNWKLAPVDVSREWTLQELTRSQNEVIGGKIFPLDDSVLQNGDDVPVGTTHLRVDVGGEPTIVAMSPLSTGMVSSITDYGAAVGSNAVSFNPVGTKEFKHLYDTGDNLVVDGLVFLGDKVIVDNYHESGDSGQLFFRVVPSGTGVSDGGKYIDLPNSGLQLEQNLKTPYDVKAWGAKGNDDQTLYPYERLVDGDRLTLYQDTFDAIRIDKTIDYAKSSGHPYIRIPAGIYRVYGYLRTLDSSVRIIGDGMDITVIKNCDNSPTDSGYGIFNSNGSDERIVELSHLTLDGSALVRGGAETRTYPFVFYGENIRVISHGLKIINSPIDCWNSNPSPNSNNSAYVTGFVFHNSFRNTMTVGGGENQTYVGGIVSGGGTVGSGTNPKACLDIEPNFGYRTVKNVKFFGTTFYNAINQLVISTWGQCDFEGCTFDAAKDSPNTDIPGREMFPWLVNSANSQTSFLDCKFYKRDNHMGIIKIYNENPLGEFVETQFSSFSSCKGEGVGVHCTGFVGEFYDVKLRNSLVPFLVEGKGRQQVQISDLTLVNVIDATNFGVGTLSSFAIKKTVEGDVYVDGLKCLIKPDMLPNENFDTSGITSQYGISINDAGATDTTWRIRNVHSDGYYRLLPNKLGLPINASIFRDWGVPNQPPVDDTSNTINPGVPSYKDCTMRGDQ